MRLTETSDATRLVAARWVVCLGLAATLLVTEPLWLSARAYPLAPLMDWLPEPPPPFDFMTYLALFPLLLATALARRSLAWAMAFEALLIYLALGDESRWHPWFYWGAYLIPALALALRRPTDARRERAGLDACRVLVVGCYVWSGLQKINVTFFNDLFPWVMSAFADSPAAHRLYARIAFTAPVVECGIGLALLVPRFRTLGVGMAAAMHLMLLASLGPLGHAVNANVWPLNACMPSLVAALFLGASGAKARDILVPRSALHGLGVLLFVVMPAFTFIDLWDAYPGFSLYSGSQRAAYIQLDAAARHRLPDPLTAYVDDQNRLLITRWALGETGAPEYAEPRIYARILDDLCKRLATASSGIELVVLGKPGRLSGARQVERRERCAAPR